jgi:enterochelin esterase family protein
MRTAWLGACALFLAACPLWAAEPNSAAKADKFEQTHIISVWPQGAPGSEKWTQKEVEYENERDHNKMVRNVTQPTLTAFLPEHSRANGTAVIVCPGGGFRFLSWTNEGTAVARWLQDRGVAAFVLKYRLVDTGATPEEFRKKMEEFARSMANRRNRGTMPEEMQKILSLAAADGRQAIKVVRQHASEWGVAPDRIGIMGFSAGGMLTTAVVLDHDADSRPNFAAPIYGGSIGDAKVAADAPPLFVLCADDDAFAAANSARLYLAWHEAHRPAELHIYAKGGHGFGMARCGLPVDHWIDRFGDWLDAQGLLKPAATEGRSAAAGTASTPAAPRRPASGDALVSPEVLPDHRVTFHIAAPKASEVRVGGDWLQGQGPAKLEKDEQGVWSVTVGPLVPDFYSYAFTVDGVKTVDPRNPTIKQGISGLDSMFFVPGPEAEFEDNRPVPHGDVRAVWYSSSTLGTQRRMHVYTPPGYDAGQDRYPVLYLLHGGGDEDSGWSTIGRAGFILDNLLAAKKAKPMLVVMPNGSLPRPANLPRFTPGQPPSPEVMAAFTALQQRFTNELLKDVVPYVEKHYRVRPGGENRALAGLSMGGGQTLRAVMTHPEEFAYVGVWSAGLGPNAADFEKRNATFLESPDKVNRAIRLFSISVGDKDFTFAGSRELSELLTRHGIKNELHVSGGGHTWINWRHYLSDFAPRLFE